MQRSTQVGLVMALLSGATGCPNTEPAIDAGTDIGERRDTPAIVSDVGVDTFAAVLPDAFVASPPDVFVTNDTGPRAWLLSGSGEKGPFITGSSVEVSLLDPVTLAPTGMTFNTSTINELGEFELMLPVLAPIQIEVNGFFFDEISGEQSTAPIVMRGFYSPSGALVDEVHVNLITHLTWHRVRALVRMGVPFNTAVDQAEDELRAQMAITAPSFDPGVRGVDLSLGGGDTDANAYLFAVSAVLLTQAGGSDAELQRLINTMSIDFEDGTLVAATRDAIRMAAASVPAEGPRSTLSDYFVSIGSTAVAPNPSRVLDGDGDGVALSTDNCPLIANSDQANPDGDASGNACDACPTVADGDGLDSDGDGPGNACDNCPFLPNADQLDRDGDHIGDVCDPEPTGGCPPMGGTCPSGGVCAAGEVACHPIGCGDGVPEGTEQCDDGNLAPGDGCNGSCYFESQEPARNECPMRPIQLVPIPGGMLGAFASPRTIDTLAGHDPNPATMCPAVSTWSDDRYLVNVPAHSTLTVQMSSSRGHTVRVNEGLCGGRAGFPGVEVGCNTEPDWLRRQSTITVSDTGGNYTVTAEAEYRGVWNVYSVFFTVRP